MKNKIFFGENGLSTTSANHIANMAKEAYQQTDEMLENVGFVEKSMKLLDSNAEKYIIQKGWNESNLKNVFNLLEKKAQYQSLIAWLREAIKAKEAIIKDIKAMGYTEISKVLGIEDADYPAEPEYPHVLTEDEYIGSLSIKERNRYYYLETLCAVIGKYIHKDGEFSRARKNLLNCIQNPTQVSGTGKETLIMEYYPTIHPETVEGIFFDLQADHRSYQAELNGMKHKMELAINASRDAADKEYEKLLTEVRTERREWNDAHAINVAQCEAWKEKQLNAARDLKIIIPNDLEKIYSEVTKLGK